jgi:hypothetical protein
MPPASDTASPVQNPRTTPGSTHIADRGTGPISNAPSTPSPPRCWAPGTAGSASVVYLDRVTGERMWAYLRNDSLSQNAGEFDSEAPPDVPR